MDSLTTIYEGRVPLPGGGTAVYNYSGVAWYRHADWLGSSRFGSTPTQTLYNDLAFAPFGEVYASTGSTDESFAGNNEDTSAALYDAQYREYGIQGRWPSPDPAGMGAANPANPQSWNRYAYVMNNPLLSTDPTGFGSMGCLVAGMQGGRKILPECADTPFGGGSGDDGIGIDGGFGPSSLAGGGPGALGNGFNGSAADVPCPNNSCYGINNVGLPTEFVATMSGNYYSCIASGSWSSQGAAGVAAEACADGPSVATNTEASGNIYMMANGEYSFTLPDFGTADTSPWGPTDIPNGTIFAGDYHTHGAFDPNYDNEMFSPAGCNNGQLCDIGSAMTVGPGMQNGQPMFVGTPQGRVEVFYPNLYNVLPNGCVLVGPPVSPGPGISDRYVPGC